MTKTSTDFRGCRSLQRTSTKSEQACRSTLLGEFLYQAQKCKNHGRFAEAESFYLSALRLDCSNPLIYRGLVHLVYDDLDSDPWRSYRRYRSLFARENSPATMREYFEGVVKFRQGLLQAAIGHFLKSLCFDHTNLYAYNNLAITYILQGRLGHADYILRRVCRQFRRQGDNKGYLLARGNVGLLAERWGFTQEALEHLRETIRMATGEYFVPERLHAVCNIGELLLNDGKSADAARWFEQAVGVSRQTHSIQQLVRSLLGLAVACRRLGKLPRTFELLKEVMVLVYVKNDSHWKAEVLRQIGTAYLTAGHRQRAVQFYESCLSQLLDVRTPSGSWLRWALDEPRCQSAAFLKRALQVLYPDRKAKRSSLETFEFLYSLVVPGNDIDRFVPRGDMFMEVLGVLWASSVAKRCVSRRPTKDKQGPARPAVSGASNVVPKSGPAARLSTDQQELLLAPERIGALFTCVGTE